MNYYLHWKKYAVNFSIRLVQKIWHIGEYSLCELAHHLKRRRPLKLIERLIKYALELLERKYIIGIYFFQARNDVIANGAP